MKQSGEKVPRPAPTLRSQRHRLPDWPTATRLAMGWAQDLAEGECIVVRDGGRQILAGRSPDRFVAMGAIRDMTRRDLQDLDARAFRPAEGRLLGGSWWVHHDAVRDHSFQGRLIVDVMHNIWRTRLPQAVEVGETLLGSPGGPQQ